MAETAVSFILTKIETLFVEEAKLLRDVRREVQDLRDELESMRAFLSDADSRGETDKSVKAWVKQVRDVAYATEDVLDDFLLRNRSAQDRRRGGFIGKTARFFKDLKPSHQIATQIQEIKTRVREIKERSERYNFNSSSNSVGENSWRDPRVASLYIEEAEIVGIDKPRDELVTLLIDGESKRKVIAVVGMGGLGKTTLVKKVFDNPSVVNSFECHAWMTVSKSFIVTELLRAMIKQFYMERKESPPKGLDTVEEVQLIGMVREYLIHKRYIVFFDDVWSIDLWESIQYALPLNNCCSRILVTTRIADVALYCVKSSGHVYNLQPMPLKEAWELFCKKAFPSDFGEQCPPVLEELSLKIVKRCGGLPLAIVAIGGLLSTKDKTVSHWKKLHDSLGSELESNPMLTNLTKILSLSYSDLPYYLKPCFLYFGIFPADYEVTCVRLIRLWVAEGFVVRKSGKSLEDVAEDYLNELICRSLIQSAGVYFNGRMRSCRVHDVLREIILSKSEEEDFCKVFVEKQNTTGFCENVRRISIQLHRSGDSNDNSIPQNTHFPHLRSLFVFGAEKMPDSFFSMHLSNFKLLKILDLQDAPWGNFPDEIVNLFHLRYLSLRNTKIKVLPKSLGKLQNLETLDLRDTGVDELPIEMFKLGQLRNLLAYRFDDEPYPTFSPMRGLKVHEGIGRLTSLQKLSMIEANQDIPNIMRELRKLTQLRRLGIAKMRNVGGMDLSTSIEKMNDLCSLIVTSIDEEELLDLQSLSTPPRFLERLYLDGRLQNFPAWISSLHNLLRIRLGWSRLRNDEAIRILEALPSLVEVFLYRAYDGEQLCFQAGGFKRLRRLKLHSLNRLNLVTVEQGAIPVLQELSIANCLQLKTVPLGMEHLTSIKRLDLYDMPYEFQRTLLRMDGEDHKKVKHIPDVFFHALCDGRFYYYSLQEFNRVITGVQMQSNVIPKSFEHLFDEFNQALLDGHHLNLSFDDVIRRLSGAQSH